MRRTFGRIGGFINLFWQVRRKFDSGYTKGAMPKQAEIRCTRCGSLLPSPDAACLCAQSNYPRPAPPPAFAWKNLTAAERRNNNAKAGMFLGIFCFLAPLAGFG